MERGEEHLTRHAAAVAGEHATGAIATVRSRRQADQQQMGGRVAEPGNGPTPVDVVAETRHLGSRDALPPRHQAGAAAARRDVSDQIAQAIAAHERRLSLPAGGPSALSR